MTRTTSTRARTAGLLAALVGIVAATVPATASVAQAAPAHPAPRDRGQAFQVSLRVSDLKPVVGDRITVSGRVGPAVPGTPLALQVRYDNRDRWKTLDRTEVRQTGRYRLVERIRTNRSRIYRVIAQGDARHAKAVSNRVRVVAYQWTPLPMLPAVGDQGWIDGVQATVNGTTYPDSFVSSGASGSVGINLARACTALDAVYGTSDSSPTGSTASVSVAADGAPLYAQAFPVGAALHRVLDVTGVFRVTLGFSATGGGQAAIGTPRALCHD